MNNSNGRDATSEQQGVSNSSSEGVTASILRRQDFNFGVRDTPVHRPTVDIQTWLSYPSQEQAYIHYALVYHLNHTCVIKLVTISPTYDPE